MTIAVLIPATWLECITPSTSANMVEEREAHCVPETPLGDGGSQTSASAPSGKAKAKSKARAKAKDAPLPIDKLVCTKCKDETSVNKSTASGGRNPWKRVCHECDATDKYCSRNLAQLKEPKGDSASSSIDPEKKTKTRGVTLSREEALALQKTLKALEKDIEAKIAWYKNEK